MQKTNLLLGMAFMFIISSCKTADDQVPEMATDFCNCFSEMEKEMSKTTISILNQSAESSDPEGAMEKAMESLNEEEKMKVAMEMASMSKIDDATSEVGLCMKKVEKKYNKSYTANEKKFGEKIIKELESKGGCSFTAAIMKLGLKMETKGKAD